MIQKCNLTVFDFWHMKTSHFVILIFLKIFSLVYHISPLIAGDFQKFTSDLVIAFTLTSISSVFVTKCLSNLSYSPSNSLQQVLVTRNLLLSHCWPPLMPFLNFVDWPYVHLGQCSYPFWVLGGLLFGLALHLYPF